jgi:hypothetical protein
VDAQDFDYVRFADHSPAKCAGMTFILPRCHPEDPKRSEEEEGSAVAFQEFNRSMAFK